MTTKALSGDVAIGHSAGRRQIIFPLASFFVAVALVAILFVTSGAGDRETELALRVTARWSFLPFWFAYSGSAIGRLFGPRLAGLTHCRREFGLAFASAQLVHVGLVLWLFHGLGSGMAFFWVGTLFTCLLVLFSLPQLRDRLAPRFCKFFSTIAIEYIALVFLVDFILLPIRNGGLERFPTTYVPFAFMILGGVGLRVASRLLAPETSPRHEAMR